MDGLGSLWAGKETPDDRGSVQVAQDNSGLEARPEVSSLGPCWAYWHVKLIDRFVSILTQRDMCRDESQNLTTIVGNLEAQVTYRWPPQRKGGQVKRRGL